MENTQHLDQFYSNNDEDGRLASRHGQVEYLTTMRYAQRYFTPGMRVLEIGAATGRYSHAIARLGYAVTAVELVAHNIELFRRNTQPGEDVEILQGNALDLHFLSEHAFDMTLLLGPMYHLYTETEQRRALDEALRVTKPGGMLLVAYCISDASIMQFGFRDRHLFDLLDKGLIDPETFKAYSTPAEVFQLYRREDIDALLRGLPVERLHYVATDLWTNHYRAAVDAMDDRMFAQYLKYHFAICERADMVGISHHVLDVLRVG